MPLCKVNYNFGNFFPLQIVRLLQAILQEQRETNLHDKENIAGVYIMQKSGWQGGNGRLGKNLK